MFGMIVSGIALVAGTAAGLLWATYSAKTRAKVTKTVAALLGKAVDEASKP